MTKRLYLRTRQMVVLEETTLPNTTREVRGLAAQVVLHADRWEQNNVDLLRSSLERALSR